MREIKFRGKATREIKEKRDDGFLYSDNCDNGVKSTESLQRIAFFWDYVACGYIDPATVGQWTGLKDCKGVDIYEGDIVEYNDAPSSFDPPEVSKYIVRFEGGHFYLSDIDGETEYDSEINISPITVIGNIHEVTNERMG